MVEEEFMIETTDKPPQRKARFPILEGRRIRLTMERDGALPAKIDAELVDISHRGVKLRVSDCPSMEEKAVLKLVVPEIHLDLSVEAHICWTRPAQEGTRASES